MLSLVHAWIIVMLSCIVCFSQVSQNCNICRMRLPDCWQEQIWPHHSCAEIITQAHCGEENQISRCWFLYIVPFMTRLQNIWEMSSRRELMFAHCAPQSPVSYQFLGADSKALEIVILVLLPRDWNALPGSITDCKFAGVSLKKVLNLLLIRYNLFSCIFVMYSAWEWFTGFGAIEMFYCY